MGFKPSAQQKRKQAQKNYERRMGHLLGRDIKDEPLIFLAFRESFRLRDYVNTGFASAVFILNKAFMDISINTIGKPEMSTTSSKIGLCPPRLVPSVWTETEIAVLFKSISKLMP